MDDVTVLPICPESITNQGTELGSHSDGVPGVFFQMPSENAQILAPVSSAGIVAGEKGVAAPCKGGAVDCLLVHVHAPTILSFTRHFDVVKILQRGMQTVNHLQLQWLDSMELSHPSREEL